MNEVFDPVVLIFVIMAGLLIGSFLNVCIYRIPKGESIIFPSSHCPSCGRKLGVAELIPVLSFLFLGGRCRICKAGISLKYPLVEVITAVLYCALYVKYGISLEFILLAYLISILVAVFFIDLQHRIIPNGLVLAGLAAGFIAFVLNFFIPVSMYGDRNWWNPLAGMAAGSGFLLLVAVIGMLIYKSDEAMGMGDVKILAPIGLLLGWKLTIVTLLAALVSGGLISIFLMITGIKKRRDAIPFGPFIVLGAFASMMWGYEFISWYFAR